MTRVRAVFPTRLRADAAAIVGSQDEVEAALAAAAKRALDRAHEVLGQSLGSGVSATVHAPEIVWTGDGLAGVPPEARTRLEERIAASFARQNAQAAGRTDAAGASASDPPRAPLAASGIPPAAAAATSGVPLAPLDAPTTSLASLHGVPGEPAPQSSASASPAGREPAPPSPLPARSALLAGPKPLAIPAPGSAVAELAPAAAPTPTVEPAHDEAQAPPPAEDGRVSLGLRWFVETVPASPIVPAGTEVTFRLRNSGDRRLGWQAGPSDAPARPVFSLREEDGLTVRSSYPMAPDDPAEVALELDRPGRHRATFGGRPVDAAAAGAGVGEPILVGTEIDVVLETDDEALAAADLSATAAEDLARAKDPATPDGELVQAFRRLAVRRAIELVGANRREAEALLALHVGAPPDEPAGQAADDVARALGLDAELAQAASRAASSGDAETIERVGAVRRTLVEAFPAVALLPVDLRGLFRDQAELREPLLRSLFERVLRDCDAAREAVATGVVDVLELEHVVRDTRAALEADGDERCAALDAALEARAGSPELAATAPPSPWHLLFAPGLLPYLAATGAGEDLAALGPPGAADDGPGTGASSELRSRSSVGAAMLWAGVDVLLAGLDVAVDPELRAAPEAVTAAWRLGQRAAGTSVAEEVAAAIAGAARDAGPTDG
ncbi:MAG TPA: hypothetical protein VF520_13375 [Thermoleophilaceae bacterium]|jgi:hypothetical protein